MLPEVSAEPKASDRVILARQLDDGLPGAVGGPVVDEDDLEAPGDAGERRPKPVVEGLQATLATVDGNDHRELDLAATCGRRWSPVSDGRL